MKTADPLDALRRFVAGYETQIAAAAALGVSPAYLSDLLRGRRDINAKMLDKLGLKQIIVKVPR